MIHVDLRNNQVDRLRKRCANCLCYHKGWCSFVGELFYMEPWQVCNDHMNVARVERLP